jgi:hypothetical protein
MTLESFYEPIAQVIMVTHACLLMLRVLARGTMTAHVQPVILLSFLEMVLSGFHDVTEEK